MSRSSLLRGLMLPTVRAQQCVTWAPPVLVQLSNRQSDEVFRYGAGETRVWLRMLSKNGSF